MYMTIHTAKMILPLPSTTTTPPSRYRYKQIFITALFVLCIPLFIFHLVPRYTSTIDNLVTHILPSSSPLSDLEGGICTKAIGNAQCCALFLAASPCVDECQKTYVDRVTLRLTRGYKECADECLTEYDNTCTKGKGV